MNGVVAGDKIITDGFQRLRDSGRVALGASTMPPVNGAKPAKN
jgi:membrane fusion protein (multidrug efflux system)